MVAQPPPPPVEPAAGFRVIRSVVDPQRAFFGAEPVRIRVRFSAAAPVPVRVRIRRRGGTVVRSYRLPATAGGFATVRWNGLTSRGRDAPDGRYFVSAGPIGGRAVRVGSLVLRGHVYPLRGSHVFRGPIGAFGAPRSGGRVHEGADILAACGTPVVAARAGKVALRRYDPVLYGHYVIVHGAQERRDYWYVHLQSPGRVPVGQRVQTGQRIGEVGNTGNAVTQGCQLHFERRGPSGPFDPLPRLRQWDTWS